MNAVSRHEIKYIISNYEAELLKCRLPALLQRDPHAGANGSYFIRSVYFDDPEFKAYNEKIAGVKERTKYRLRFYNMDDRVLFLEKKSKNGDLTGKESARVNRALAEAMLSGDERLAKLPSLPGEFGRLRQGVYRPVVIVDYERYPFEYRDGNVRVTIDTDIRTAPYQTDIFHHCLLKVPVMDPGESVLEIKYDAFLPASVRALLEGVRKQRSAVSKYTKCLGILE